MMNRLRIAGIEYTSTIDWYGKSSIVFFLTGCNFRCVYCQNHEIIPASAGKWISLDEIMRVIKENEPFINAVVFTGGEPTLQKKPLKKICKRIKKETKLSIMLDTNGSYFEVIQDLLNEDLIDRVALDVKSRLMPEYYDEITGINSNQYLDSIWITMKSVKAAGKELEVRTTIVPGINDSIYLMDKIAEKILWYANDLMLQQCIMKNTLDESLRTLESPSRDKLLGLAQIAKQAGIKNVYIKTLEKGFEKI